MSRTSTAEIGVENHPTVSQDEWVEAGRKLLTKEKELTRLRDEMNRMRRELPWVRVEKGYVFEAPEGKVTLSELFLGRSQLILYHMMYGPGWDEGCPGCSFISDHVDAARQHFERRDIAYVAVSRASLADFMPYKKRMGWTFQWVSSAGSDFNYDFGASFRPADLAQGPVLYNFTMQKLSGEEQPGLSVFYRDEKGRIFRTYSTYERGLDLLLGAYNFIDLTPKGRGESSPMDWVQYHDSYGE